MTFKSSNLKWFLDFMWADFGRVSEGEMGKYAVELNLKTMGRPIAGPDPRAHGERVAEASAEADLFNYGPGEGGRLRLERLQAALRNRFLSMMSLVDQAKSTGFPLTPVDFGDIKTVGLSSELLFAESTQTTVTRAHVQVKAIKKSDLKGHSQVWPENDLMNTPIQVWEVAGSEEETLLLYFIRALHGVTLSQIRQCPECGRYFLHSTQRKKVYCSNPCAARKGSRNKRAKMKVENPEKYKGVLEENNKRARKSYENKIEQKHPKAKIERRPRVKKEN